MHDTIVIGMENWDGVWRRMQPVTAGLARRNPRNKHLFVGLNVDVSHALRTGNPKVARDLLSRSAVRRSPDLENVYLLNTTKLFPDTIAAGRILNQALARRQVRSAAARLGMKSPVLYMNPHYAVSLVGRLDEVVSIYDIGDDWISLPQKEATRQRTIREDRELCARADAVIVVSETLFELKRGMAKNLHHIPNGVDVERYTPVRGKGIAVHPAAQDWKRPVAAYTGTVHKDRVDLDLITAVASRMPDVTFVFVGPVQLDEANRKKITSPPNVVLAGEFPYADVPSVMAGFDVCCVPHLVTPFTMSLSPLKLYEYLASGLPIVSTPVSGFKDFPDHVRLASTPAEFEQAIRAALTEAPERGEARQRAASQHSWAARLDSIQQVIDDCIDSKAEPVKCGRSIPSYR